MTSQFTLKTKLAACVAVMLALTMALSYAGLSAAGEFKRQYDYAVENTTRKIQIPANIETAIGEMISAQHGIMVASYSKEPADAEVYKEAFRTNAQAIKTALTEMQPLIVKQEVRDLAADISERLGTWQLQYDEFVRQCAAGNMAEADRVRKEQTVPVYRKIKENAQKISKLQEAILAEAKAALVSQYSLAQWISYLLLGLSIVAGGVVGLFVRNVSRTLRSAVNEIAEGAGQVAGAASQVASSSQALAQGSSEQAASLEETSASTEEINSMASRNTESSRAAADLVGSSQGKFVETNQSLEDTVVAMNEITAQSGKISKIIKTIDEIAFQTNILALNAAVEAARAGEAGMGFAVVADEVRNLSQRCAQAAKDTASLIEESISKSSHGQAKVDQVAEAIRSITQESERIKTLVDEVNLGSQEQARGLEQIGKAVSQMEQVTQRTAASAEQSASAAEELTAQSETLRSVVGRLTALVGSDSGRTA